MSTQKFGAIFGVIMLNVGIQDLTTKFDYQKNSQSYTASVDTD